MTPILGAPEATQSQATRWVLDRAHARFDPAYDDFTLEAIVGAYWRTGEEEGVRADVAVAQAVKETAAFTFTGSVRPGQNNFAGIGATGGGVPGESWPTVNEGIRGHLRRLRMYAEGFDAIHDLDILKRPLPRYLWGSAPTVEDLGGKWAPTLNYGASIVNDYLTPMIATRVGDWFGHPAEEEITVALDEGMTLYSDGTFRPDTPATRADIALIVARLR